MSDQAQRRISAIGQQLKPSSSSSDLPPIQKVAPGSSKLRVEGKVVIITGTHTEFNLQLLIYTSSLRPITGTNSPLGIGRATAHQYAESGARAIYICDYDGTHLETHKKEITTAFPGVDVHAWQFDASEEAKVKEVVDDAMSRYGRLDVFFANAGVVGKPTLFQEFTPDEFMSVLKINVLKYVSPCLSLLCVGEY